MKIITDHKWKPFRYGNEVPRKVLKDQFDYLADLADTDSDSDNGFIYYRKRWYHLSEFVNCYNHPNLKKKWDGLLTDSFFSGIVIKIGDDGETYKIGLILA